MAKPLTQAVIAQKAGISKVAVYQQLKKGKTAEEIIASGKIRAARLAAGERIGGGIAGVAKSHSHSGGGGARGSGGGGGARARVGRPSEGPVKGRDSSGKLHTMNEADIRNKLAVAEKNELELAKMRGELAPVAHIKSWFGGILIRTRDILMGIQELAERVRQAPDEIAARQIIDTEHRRALEEMSRYAKFTSATQQLANGKQTATPNHTPETAAAETVTVIKAKRKAVAAKSRK